MPHAAADPLDLPPRDERKKALAMKLTVLARQLWLEFDQDAERIGLSRAKWSVVVEATRDPGATQRTIAARLKVTDVTVGRLIDRLCAEGLLERHENPEDRRAYRVYPKAAAQPVLAQLQELAAAHVRKTFAGLDDDGLAALDGLLDAISRNVAGDRAG